MNIVREIAIILQFVISFSAGIYFVFFSRQAQEMFFFLLRSKCGWLLFLTRWGNEDERNSYIWRFRFVGVIALVVAAGVGRELLLQVMHFMRAAG